MSSTDDLRARLVPAVCTQCGAALEVDPTQEAAVCKYCNTPFIVDKAIQNYNIKNAKIEHVDTVNIDMKGTADSFFSFVGRQMSESREARREERHERRAESHEINMAFMKIFGYMMIGMFVFAVIAFVVMQFTGGPRDDTPAEPETQIVSTAVPESSGSDNGAGASFDFEIHTGGSN